MVCHSSCHPKAPLTHEYEVNAKLQEVADFHSMFTSRMFMLTSKLIGNTSCWLWHQSSLLRVRAEMFGNVQKFSAKFNIEDLLTWSRLCVYFAVQLVYLVLLHVDKFWTWMRMKWTWSQHRVLWSQHNVKRNITWHSTSNHGAIIEENEAFQFSL